MGWESGWCGVAPPRPADFEVALVKLFRTTALGRTLRLHYGALSESAVELLELTPDEPTNARRNWSSAAATRSRLACTRWNAARPSFSTCRHAATAS